MDIATLCRREVVSIPSDASLQQAAARMREEHVGALVVTDAREAGRIVGVVTDRDLVVEVLAQGVAPGERNVGSLCARDLVAIPSAATLHEAIGAMRRAGVRRVLVMRPDQSLAGLVSADDLLQQLAEELEGIAAALRVGAVREEARTRGGADAPPPALFLPRNEP